MSKFLWIFFFILALDHSAIAKSIGQSSNAQAYGVIQSYDADRLKIVVRDAVYDPKVQIVRAVVEITETSRPRIIVLSTDTVKEPTFIDAARKKLVLLRASIELCSRRHLKNCGSTTRLETSSEQTSIIQLEFDAVGIQTSGTGMINFTIGHARNRNQSFSKVTITTPPFPINTIGK